MRPRGAARAVRHLVTFSVDGRPASFATSHELAWKEAVAAAVAAHVPSPWPHERFSVRIEFRTSPPTGPAEVWDLDNLIKPTLDAMAGVFGARAWRGVPQPADDRVDHIDARKRTARPDELPGAVVEVWAMGGEVGAPPFHREDLVDRGFLGFVPLLDLDSKVVPKAAGVYVVLREQDERPEFLDANPAGRFKGKDPTVAGSLLASIWTEGAHCIYIGKANKTATTDLRRRLTDFREYGRGRPVGHQGGRYIWQMSGSDQYLVAWMETPDADPATVESALIAEFRSHYGARPLGNLKD